MRSPRGSHPPVRDAIAGMLGVVLRIAAAGFLGACGGKAATAARPSTAPPAPVAIAAIPLPPVESTCGLPGMPDCPLQGWMDNHLSGPLSRDDYPALMRAFREPGVAPAGFSGWGAWAQGGEAAADQQDHAAVQKACTGCHDGYRERYRQTLRDRPMPGSEQP